MDEDRLGALAAAAVKTADGMGKVAGDKPDKTPLHSDAMTFRGIAAMLTTLSAEARGHGEASTQLRRTLQRIAALEIRDGAALIERGDWKKVVGELQAIAQEGLGQGGGEGRGRRR